MDQSSSLVNQPSGGCSGSDKATPRLRLKWAKSKKNHRVGVT